LLWEQLACDALIFPHASAMVSKTFSCWNEGFTYVFFVAGFFSGFRDFSISIPTTPFTRKIRLAHYYCNPTALFR